MAGVVCSCFAMLADESKCIVPVMIEHTKDYSWVLQERIYFDISSARFDEEKLHRIVYEIASNVGYWLHNRQSISLLKETDAQGFAAFAAENVRSATSQERA